MKKYLYSLHKEQQAVGFAIKTESPLQSQNKNAAEKQNCLPAVIECGSG